MKRPPRRGARARGYGQKWETFAQAFALAWVRDGRPCSLCGLPFRPGRRIDVDHIVPLVEAPERMFDPTNLRAVHGWCHSRRTMQDRAASARGYRLGVGPDGLPLDPAHPFSDARQRR